MKQKLGPRQKKWLAALRSGKYEQGKMFLKLDNRFCCLGIACDIVKNILNFPISNKLNVRSGNYVTNYDGEDIGLPKTVQDYFKFISKQGGNYVATALSHLNDKGKTFQEIADIVTKNPEYYFSEIV